MHCTQLGLLTCMIALMCKTAEDHFKFMRKIRLSFQQYFNGSWAWKISYAIMHLKGLSKMILRDSTRLRKLCLAKKRKKRNNSSQKQTLKNKYWERSNISHFLPCLQQMKQITERICWQGQRMMNALHETNTSYH